MRNLLKITSLLMLIGSIQLQSAQQTTINIKNVANTASTIPVALTYSPYTTNQQFIQEVITVTGIPASNFVLMNSGAAINNNNSEFASHEDCLLYIKARQALNPKMTSYSTAYNNLNKALSNGSIADLTTAIQAFKALDPAVTETLFRNGNTLNYQTLNSVNDGNLKITDIRNIAQAAGLQGDDLISYVTGNYIGPVDNSGINMGGAGGNLGGDTAQQQDFNNLKAAVASIQKNGAAATQQQLDTILDKVSSLTTQIQTAKEQGQETSDLETELAEASATAKSLSDALDLEGDPTPGVAGSV